MKSRSKVALFSNECHFEIWFQKKKTITFFWSKLFKLHKKDPILHVATLFSLKQRETRTNHGPIPHPLRCLLSPPCKFWLIFKHFPTKIYTFLQPVRSKTIGIGNLKADFSKSHFQRKPLTSYTHMVISQKVRGAWA